MSNRTWRLLLAGITGLLLAAGTAVGTTAAVADPILCPGGQVSTKTATGWNCVNGGNNVSNAEDPKNPNAEKGDF
jgi:hypothetical protein